MVYVIEEIPSSILKPSWAFYVQNLLTQMEQFEITGTECNLGEKPNQSCGNSTKVYCIYIHVNPGCMVWVWKRNESCCVWE